MQKFLNTILNTFSGIRVNDIIDILLVTFVIYQVFMLLYETRAIQMLKGFLVILFFVVVAKILELNTMTWILTGLSTKYPSRPGMKSKMRVTNEYKIFKSL